MNDKERGFWSGVGGRIKEGWRGGVGLFEGSLSVVWEVRGGSSVIVGRDCSWKWEGDCWRFMRRGGW